MTEPRQASSHQPASVVRVYSRLDVGGIERQLLRVLPRLEARGRYRTTLILTRREGTLLPEFREAGIPVEVVPLRGRLNPRSVRTLAARFRHHRARLVHAHVYEANTTATVAARFAGRPPVIASLHNLGTVRGLRRRLQDRILNRFRAAVVCVSQGVRENYLAEVGAPPDRVTVLYNGIDVEAIRAVPPDRDGMRAEFGFPPGSPVVTCVSRLKAHKGHGDLLEALARLAPREPGVRLLVVGDGPERPALEARSRAPDLKGRVTFTGNRDDVPRLLRSSDLAALASLREGFSNVVLECLAAGLPLVVTDVGGNREAMDGERTGLLVPPRDPQALARGLERLLVDDALRIRLAKAAAERALRFDLERTLDETEALYDRLLGGITPAG
jgi:glycosyltransferase involved in cell wall biosynthesis